MAAGCAEHHVLAPLPTDEPIGAYQRLELSFARYPDGAEPAAGASCPLALVLIGPAEDELRPGGCDDLGYHADGAGAITTRFACDVEDGSALVQVGISAEGEGEAWISRFDAGGDLTCIAYYDATLDVVDGEARADMVWTW